MVSCLINRGGFTNFAKNNSYKRKGVEVWPPRALRRGNASSLQL